MRAALLEKDLADERHTHRIIVNEHGQVQVTRLDTKSLIFSTHHFNNGVSSEVVYCEHRSDESAVEMGLKLAEDARNRTRKSRPNLVFGQGNAASHLFSFAIAAYFIVTIFLILVMIVR